MNTTRWTCPACNKETAHNIRACAEFVHLGCSECNGVSRSFTQDEMKKTLLSKVKDIDTAFADITHMPNMRVFISHHLGEAEVTENTLALHLRITGKIPAVGNKLMALPPGLALRPFAIPIGEIVRVELE